VEKGAETPSQLLVT